MNNGKGIGKSQNICGLGDELDRYYYIKVFLWTE